MNNRSNFMCRNTFLITSGINATFFWVFHCYYSIASNFEKFISVHMFCDKPFGPGTPGMPGKPRAPFSAKHFGMQFPPDPEQFFFAAFGFSTTA